MPLLPNWESLSLSLRSGIETAPMLSINPGLVQILLLQIQKSKRQHIRQFWQTFWLIHRSSAVFSGARMIQENLIAMVPWQRREFKAIINPCKPDIFAFACPYIWV